MNIKYLRSTRLRLLLLSSLSIALITVSAQQPRRTIRTSQTTNKRTRLVIGIIIDQFRYDYLNRFEDQFGEGGFKRLLKSGAVFANANYIQIPTVTACGHSTFMSGATPAQNGIIGNEWYDRVTGKNVTSVSDDSVKLLGGREGARGMSPSKLIGSTIGDELKLASNGQSKVIGISLKDRSAILPAGKHPNAAYWFDDNTGNLVSSTYYFKDLPEWVKKFNNEQRPDRFFGRRWEKLLPESAEDGPDKYYQFEVTPFGNDYLIDFARAAIENEDLGKDDITDLLTISLSSNDLIGHAYGPYSREVQDVTLRTDRLLADFFAYLDKKFGLDRVMIVLTSDHGVAPLPEQGYGGRLQYRALADAVEKALDQRFEDEKWVLSTINHNVYLDEAAIERKKLSIEDVERAACGEVVKIPGIAECFTGSQIAQGKLPIRTAARGVANGYYPRRNGNLVVVEQPLFFFSELSSGTTHSTGYSYDEHVPVIVLGASFTPGVYYNASSPADIAPTIAAVLKIEAPSNSVGRILSEAIK